MSDFILYMDKLLRGAGYSSDSRQRILRRYCEGRAQHAGTKEDFDRPGFDFLTAAIEERDDVCVYQIKEIYKLAVANSKPSKSQHISTLVVRALRHEALADKLIAEAIAIAQTATPECDQTADAPSARPADGRPARSEMACVGWWEDAEARFYGY